MNPSHFHFHFPHAVRDKVIEQFLCVSTKLGTFIITKAGVGGFPAANPVIIGAAAIVVPVLAVSVIVEEVFD